VAQSGHKGDCLSRLQGASFILAIIAK
jgi:hypothetical protein